MESKKEQLIWILQAILAMADNQFEFQVYYDLLPSQENEANLSALVLATLAMIPRELNILQYLRNLIKTYPACMNTLQECSEESLEVRENISLFVSEFIQQYRLVNGNVRLGFIGHFFENDFIKKIETESDEYRQLAIIIKNCNAQNGHAATKVWDQVLKFHETNIQEERSLSAIPAERLLTLS